MRGASYLLPSSLQKRLLRYALSRLELLDTDALDLENLDIIWGKRSVVELRDVGLRSKKIASLLQLPKSLELKRATILLLRITLPADIYSSGIVVEVEGVDVQVQVVGKTDLTGSSYPGHDRHGESHQTRSPNQRSPQRTGFGTSDEDEPFLEDEDEMDRLPTTEDLAMSFLQTEPLAERVELQAAITSQSPTADEADNEDGEDESVTGTGTPLSLPGFLAGFLQGISDRLEVRVRRVKVDLDVDLRAEGSFGAEAWAPTDPLTIRLKVEDVDIKGVASEQEDPGEKDNIPGIGGRPQKNQAASDAEAKSKGRKGKRCIQLRNIQGILISEAALFENLARVSAPPSPAMTHSSLPTDRKDTENHPGGNDSVESAANFKAAQDNISVSSSSSDNPDSDMIQSVIFQPSALHHVAETRGNYENLEASIATSDGSRFADAGDEDEYEIGDARRHTAPSGDLGESFLDYSAYLDQVSESRFDDGDVEDDEELRNLLSKRGVGTQFGGQHVVPMTSGLVPVSNAQISSQPERDSSLGNLSSLPVPPTVPRLLHSAQLSITSTDRRAVGSVSHSTPVLPRSLSPPSLETARGPGLAAGVLSRPYNPGEDSDEGHSSADEDLAESRIFSHEEAESMYMSALSHAQDSPTAVSHGSNIWESSDSENSSAEIDKSGVSIHQSPSSQLGQSSEDLSSLCRSVEEPPERDTTPTPERQTEQISEPIESAHSEELLCPVQPDALSDLPLRTAGQDGSVKSDYSRIEKRIVYVDHIALWLPSPALSEVRDDVVDDRIAVSSRIDSMDSFHPGMPGAFSTPSLRIAPTKAPRASEVRTKESSKAGNRSGEAGKALGKQPESAQKDLDDSIELDIGTMTGSADISICRIMLKMAQHLLETTDDFKPPNPPLKAQSSPSSNTAFKLRVAKVSLKFLEHVATLAALPQNLSHEAHEELPIKPAVSDVLLRTTLKGIELSNSGDLESSTMLLSIQKFIFGYPKDDILSFDASLRMRSSTRDFMAPVDKDISLSIRQSRTSRDIYLTTLPLLLSVDLQRLDDTFSWLGGFSSILGLGSLTASNATITGVPKASKRPRGVHFEPPPEISDPAEASLQLENRVDARIGGVTVELVGKDCSVQLNSTALKLVSRDEGIGMQVDKIKVSGPHISGAGREASVFIEVKNTRVEYLSTPKEVDIGRLLSLLTPSKNKYGQDDDILLDTLIRQRKQGPVLRITFGTVIGDVSSVEDLRILPSLGEEVAKLATVTKYLPEDERPGIMTLALLKDLRFQVRVSDELGELQLGLQNLETAHVSLPSLLALSIGKVHMTRNTIEDLLGEASQSSPISDGQSPMVMARMIGDELEPTIKVKLWNVRLEYMVSTVLAAMGLSDDMTGEEAMADMVDSIATLTDRNLRRESVSKASTISTPSEKSNGFTKPLRVEIVFQDCVIGLNPLGIPSKALIVLTETRLYGSSPHKEPLQAVLEINKASLLIIDDTKNFLSAAELPVPRRRQSMDYGSRQVSDFCQRGYVSVSYISSARAVFKLLDLEDEGRKCVDLELRDDLLVLESCADSTQTLLSVINGLKPPTPPSRDIKYRTEIVPVQDMLALLSGEEFAPSTPADGRFPLELDEGDIVDDDVPQNLEFVESFYRPESAPTSEEVANSMLEDELGQLASPPKTRELGGKVLLESFREQYSVAPNEPLEFHEDYFGLNSVVDVTAHNWDSVKNTYSAPTEVKVRGSPLTVRVRDVHVIWNLYDGYDWQKTRDTISKAVKEVEVKTIERRARRNERRVSFDMEEEEESVIGDMLFNSIYISIPPNRDPRELSNQINRNFDDLASEAESYTTSAVSHSPSRQNSQPRGKGKKLRLNRSRHHKITFELKGVSADLVVFPPGEGETQSSLDVRVRDMEIFDHVPTSTWKKFVTYMHDAGERESGSSMIHLEILNVKPIPDLAASEIVLKATILPLRLHVDQDALDFITRFFEFKDDSIPIHTSPADVPFLQRVEVNAVRVKLDYKPKTVDYAGLRSGHTTEFMNFFILDEADMILRHVIIYGISGFDKLSKTLNDIWMPDIKQNQLPGILAGLAPVRSLVNVGGGVRDLVFIPMREYKKDGRIVRSVQKGALAFAKTTTSELVKLGAKIAVGTQTALQGAEGFLLDPAQSGNKTAGEEEEEPSTISLYANQPVGVRQGLRGAYASLERDLLTARDAIVAVPGEIMESGSAQGAAKAVLRRAPTVIFRPVIGASKAISQTLMGATNALDPEHRRRIEDKYKKY